jgi:DNA-binding HxlR family transcriptional regulator
MRSHAQYCPVAKGTEILGDRWTLLIVREMLGGASGFNELQRGLPGISRSVLTDRMRALERAEVIERRTGPKGRTLEYRLTPAVTSSRSCRRSASGGRRGRSPSRAPRNSIPTC